MLMPNSDVSPNPEMLFNALSVCLTKRNLWCCYLNSQMEYLPALLCAPDLISCRVSHLQHVGSVKHRDAAVLALPQTLGQLCCP